MQTTPSLGYVIGGIGVAILLLAALAWLFVAVVNLRARLALRDANDRPYGLETSITDWKFGVAIGAILSPILAAILFLGILFPYDLDYHRYVVVQGKVEQVASRQISDGKAMSQRYVVILNGRPYGVDDTRAALLKAGDDVTLSCIKDYQWAAESGWVCNWGQQ